MDKKSKILVIDDEKELCFLIKNILEKTGEYEILTAHDGEEGCRLCLKEKPDLIFLDYVMPNMKGDDVIKFLQKNLDHPRIPIILVSGLGEQVYSHEKIDEKWEDVFKDVAVVKAGMEEKVSVRWKVAPQELTEKTGIAANLPKPFNKVTLITITGSILNKNYE